MLFMFYVGFFQSKCLDPPGRMSTLSQKLDYCSDIAEWVLTLQPPGLDVVFGDVWDSRHFVTCSWTLDVLLKMLVRWGVDE